MGGKVDRWMNRWVVVSRLVIDRCRWMKERVDRNNGGGLDQCVVGWIWVEGLWGRRMYGLKGRQRDGQIEGQVVLGGDVIEVVS